MDSEARLLLLLLAVLGSCALTQAVNYEVIGDNQKFFRPCGKEDSRSNLRVSDYVDISSLTHVYTEDMETVLTNGDIVVKKTVPTDVPIKVEMEVLHWRRGQWVATVLSVRRDDLCKSLFSPVELWHPLVMQIPPEQRVCPPTAGSIYSMINITNRMVVSNMPTSELSGRYKIISHLIVGSGTMCAEVLVNIYKIRKPSPLPGVWKIPIKIVTDVVNKTLRTVEAG